MKRPRLTAAFFLPDTSHAFEISRQRLSPYARCPVHTHDFIEVFWVVEGSGIHLVNGKRQPLHAGSAVTMRPGDYHGFVGLPDKGKFTVVSVIFRTDTLAFLRRRYFADSKSFFWATTPLPFSINLNPSQQSWMWRWTDYYLTNASHRSQAAIDSFLLELLQMNVRSAATAPAWVDNLTNLVRNPKYFAGGTAALADAVGRSPEHVNRALKRYFGMTATELLNQARMERAAMQLIAGEKKILDICQECGFQNVGHFYKVFEDYFHDTPYRYRRRQRALLP